MKEAKDYLRSLNEIQTAIRILTKEINRRQGMQPDPEIDERLQAERKRYEDLREKMTREIASLSDSRFQRVLYHVYVENLPLWKVARIMHYSDDHTNRVHQMALKAFDERFFGKGQK